MAVMVDACTGGRGKLLARAIPAVKDPRSSGAPTPWEITAIPKINEMMMVGIMPLVRLEEASLAKPAQSAEMPK